MTVRLPAGLNHKQTEKVPDKTLRDLVPPGSSTCATGLARQPRARARPFLRAGITPAPRPARILPGEVPKAFAKERWNCESDWKPDS